MNPGSYISAGNTWTVGVDAEGRVYSTDGMFQGALSAQQNVTGEQYKYACGIATGIVGIRSDRTVGGWMGGELKEWGYWDRLEMDKWTNLVQISGKMTEVYALTESGEVYSTSWQNTTKGNSYLDWTKWTDIIRIAAGLDNEVVMAQDKNGKIYVSLGNIYEASEWENITHFDVGYRHAVSVKRDGSVVACGDNTYSQCNIETWNLIVKSLDTDSSLYFDGTYELDGFDYNGEAYKTYGEQYADMWRIKFSADGSVGFTVHGPASSYYCKGTYEISDTEVIMKVIDNFDGRELIFYADRIDSETIKITSESGYDTRPTKDDVFKLK